MALFGGKASGTEAGAQAGRVSRFSSGWVQMLKFLGSSNSLRVLDFGPTSAGNINFITNLGHSIYMANFVEDAARPEYLLPSAPGEAAELDRTRFLAENLDFQGRNFDVVLLWDTLDYLPKELVQPIADRLYDVMSPDSQLLAFFHAATAPGAVQNYAPAQKASTNKATGSQETTFTRYHLTENDHVELQRIGGHPILQTQTNREVEATFHRYSGYKFFLAKDNLREVIVTR